MMLEPLFLSVLNLEKRKTQKILWRWKVSGDEFTGVLMPAITVLTVTGRDLFRKENADCLKAQTFRDFEWVFVDDLFTQTNERMLQYVGDSFPFTHIMPKNIVPYFAVSAALNDGLVRASGELVVFKQDYILLHPTCLKRLWDTHCRYPKAILSGRCLEVGFHPSELLTKQGAFTGRDYRMSLFTNGLFPWSYMNQNLYGVDRGGAQNWWAGKNDAAPLEALIECNGMDELFDGHHGYSDDDLANRLMTYGCDYIFDTEALSFEFTHTKHSKETKQESNQPLKDKLIPQRVRDKIYRANPHRNLREEREWILTINK